MKTTPNLLDTLADDLIAVVPTVGPIEPDGLRRALRDVLFVKLSKYQTSRDDFRGRGHSLRDWNETRRPDVEAVRLILARRNLTQAGLAARLGVTRAAVSKGLTLDRWTLRRAQRYASALGVQVDEITVRE